MELITMTKEQLDKIVEESFKSGESWGVCYNTWFIPSKNDTNAKIEIAKKRAIKSVEGQSFLKTK